MSWASDVKMRDKLQETLTACTGKCETCLMAARIALGIYRVHLANIRVDCNS